MATALILLAIGAIVLFAAVAYRAWVAPAPRQSDGHTASCVSIRALRNLINEDDDAYLRSHLSKRQYERLQRKKFRAARAYALELSQYGAGMAALGQAAKQSANADLSAAADHLVDTAIRLRSVAFLVRLNLGTRLLFSGSASLKQLIAHYERVQDAAGSLALARAQLYSTQMTTATKRT